MTWNFSRKYGLLAAAAGAIASVLLANSYVVDNRELAAQRQAETSGVVASAVVAVVLGASEQDRMDLQVDTQGAKRMARIFTPDHPITQGMTVRAAWTETDPRHVFLVGEHPWTWWAAMGPLFGTVAVVSIATALIGLLLDFTFGRSESRAG